MVVRNSQRDNTLVVNTVQKTFNGNWKKKKKYKNEKTWKKLNDS